MSTAFWIVQILLLMPLILMVFCFEADRDRARHLASPRLHLTSPPLTVPVPVAPVAPAPAARSAQPAPADPARASLADQFTLREQARLLILRGCVQDAKMGQGALRDDLVGGEPGWTRALV